MKLFLTSVSIAKKNQVAFWKLVGKQKDKISVALIENGSDTYPENNREWVKKAESMIRDSAARITKFDLRTYENPLLLKQDLTGYDVIWVGGGNVFYLRWLAKKSGFDKVIVELCKEGVIYGGDSAGAILAGPTIDHFQPADTPENAPLIVLEGLNLTQIVVVPHYDHTKYAPIMIGIENALRRDGYGTVHLNDDEAISISGAKVQKV